MTIYPHPACMEPDGGEGPCAGYLALASENERLRSALRQAEAWLRLQPLAATGNASDTFYRYAAKLGDYGLSREAQVELLHRYNPSYDEDDIGKRVSIVCRSCCS